MSVPMVGAGLGFGWKKDSNIYFVDGIQGSNDNIGNEPDDSLATIEKALTKANAYDVIYVMDKATSSSILAGYTGASANQTITTSHTGLALIGVSHAALAGYPMTPALIGLAATETPILTVQAHHVAIENLAFVGGWANSTTATCGIKTNDNYQGFGISIYNCMFEDLEAATPTMSHASGTPGGGISLIGGWYSVVSHCRFRNCVTGIQVMSGTTTAVATTLEDNIFFADATTDVNVDIATYCQGTNSVLIKGNYFAHNLPTYASGDAVRYIYCFGAEVGIITDNHLGHSSVLTAGPAGTGIIAPATCGVGVNYCECALMASG